MIYCGVESNSKNQNDGDNDNSNDDDDTAEVFFSMDDARLIRQLLLYFSEGSRLLI